MGHSTLDEADIFRRHGDPSPDDAGASLSMAQRRVMTAIAQCRTAALGGHIADRRENEKTMALGATEFIRRFRLHVLPGGFHRMRYYGLLGSRTRREKLAHCRRLLHMAPPATCAPTAATVPADYRDRYETLTGVSLRTCPRCHDDRMLIIEHLIGARGCPAMLDSS